MTSQTRPFSVRHHPISTPFTRIPLGANSAALFLVSVTNALLAQEYPSINGAPPLLATEQMLTIDPMPRSRFISIMCCVACLVIRNGARTLVSYCSLNDAAVVVARLPLAVVAAALTIMDW